MTERVKGMKMKLKMKMKNESYQIITQKVKKKGCFCGGNERGRVVMQIDGNWKLCQDLKSVSPIRLGINFG